MIFKISRNVNDHKPSFYSKVLISNQNEKAQSCQRSMERMTEMTEKLIFFIYKQM